MNVMDSGADGSEDDDYVDDDNSNDLKLKMIRRGNKLFRVRNLLIFTLQSTFILNIIGSKLLGILYDEFLF